MAENTPSPDLIERMLAAYMDDSLAPGYDMRRAARVMIEAMRKWSRQNAGPIEYDEAFDAYLDAFIKENHLDD